MLHVLILSNSKFDLPKGTDRLQWPFESAYILSHYLNIIPTPVFLLFQAISFLERNWKKDYL